MGLPPLPVARLVEYVRQVRGLLAGEDVLFREGKAERWIRLLSRDRRVGMVNLDDPIPIHIAANAPKALAAAGTVGDGWITVGMPPEADRGAAARWRMRRSAAGRRSTEPAAGRTRPSHHRLRAEAGGGAERSRVIRRVGPVAVVAVHAMWEARAAVTASARRTTRSPPRTTPTSRPTRPRPAHRATAATSKRTKAT